MLARHNKRTNDYFMSKNSIVKQLLEQEQEHEQEHVHIYWWPMSIHRYLSVLTY